jgi:hypothetical protein
MTTQATAHEMTKPRGERAAAREVTTREMTTPAAIKPASAEGFGYGQSRLWPYHLPSALILDAPVTVQQPARAIATPAQTVSISKLPLVVLGSIEAQYYSIHSFVLRQY